MSPSSSQRGSPSPCPIASRRPKNEILISECNCSCGPGAKGCEGGREDRHGDGHVCLCSAAQRHVRICTHGWPVGSIARDAITLPRGGP